MILISGRAGFIGSNIVLCRVARADEPLINVDTLTYAHWTATQGAARAAFRFPHVGTDEVRGAFGACPAWMRQNYADRPAGASV